MKRNYRNDKKTNEYRSLINDLSTLPFSFIYDGKEYKGFSPEYFTLINKNVTCFDEKETQTFKFDFLQTLNVT